MQQCSAEICVAKIWELSLPFPQVLLFFAENILAKAELVQTLPAPPPYPLYLLSTLDRAEIFHHIHKLNRHMKGNHDDSILAFGTCRQILFAPFFLPPAVPFITLPQFTWLYRQTTRKNKTIKEYQLSGCCISDNFWQISGLGGVESLTLKSNRSMRLAGSPAAHSSTAMVTAEASKQRLKPSKWKAPICYKLCTSPVITHCPTEATLYLWL